MLRCVASRNEVFGWRHVKVVPDDEFVSATPGGSPGAQQFCAELKKRKNPAADKSLSGFQSTCGQKTKIQQIAMVRLRNKSAAQTTAKSRYRDLMHRSNRAAHAACRYHNTVGMTQPRGHPEG